jgi:hypothetical protein
MSASNQKILCLVVATGKNEDWTIFGIGDFSNHEIIDF